MKKLLRFGEVLLSAAIATTMLSACSDKPPASKSPDSQTVSVGSDGSKEVPTLTWYQIGNAPTDLQAGIDNINSYIVDKVGAKIDIKYYTWGEYEEKINNMLNTGEYFDIMFAHTTYFTGHASQGKFLKLDDKLNTVAPELKSFVQDELWKAVTIKDGIYGVPTAKDSAATQYFAFDKAMVEKYSIDLNSITSLDTLEPVLKKIKEGEEKETGKKVYPFYLHKEGYTAWQTDYDNYIKWDDETATVQNTFERPEIQEIFETLHRWADEGLINPDASTLDNAPKYRICFAAQAFPGAEEGWKAEYGYEIVSVPFTQPIISSNTVHGSVNVISANSKYPDEALKFLQLANTDRTLRDMIAYGIENTHWKSNGDGTITKIGDKYNTATYCQASTYTLSPIAPNPSNQYELVKEMTKNAKAHIILGFAFDDTKVSTEAANINATIDKYKAELYTGVYSGTTADYLKKLNDELKSAGMEKMLAEIQSQVNTFLGK